MAPELLSCYANSYFDLEAYKQADMYSFGLVLWEMCSKTKTYKNSEVSLSSMRIRVFAKTLKLIFVPLQEHCESYTLPYSNHVAPNPTLEEMQEVVCEKVSHLSILTLFTIYLQLFLFYRN